jgi:signal peptidase II
MRAVPLSRYLVFFPVALGGCAADLATKSWMFRWLGMPHSGGSPWWLWPNVVGCQTSLNEGALFGFGQGMVPLFALLSITATAAILWWLFWTGAARDWLLCASLASVTAGILGNLYDRLGLPGLVWNYAGPRHEVGAPVYAVRDWILVMIGDWPWPNFNIADSLLVCGAGLLLWHAFWTKPDTEARQAPAGEPLP